MKEWKQIFLEIFLGQKSEKTLTKLCVCAFKDLFINDIIMFSQEPKHEYTAVVELFSLKLKLVGIVSAYPT